jgi:hypothetical protein
MGRSDEISGTLESLFTGLRILSDRSFQAGR